MSTVLSKSRNIFQWIYASDKALIRSSPIILQKSVLRCCKVEFALFYLGFLSRIFMIHRTAEQGEAISLWFVLSVWLLSWYVFSTAKSLFKGRLRIVLIFAILTIAPLISKSLPGNTRVTMAILQKCLGTFS